MQRFVSAILWLAILVLTTLWLPLLALIFLVTAPFDPGRYTAGRWFRRAAVASVAINPLWKFRTSGWVPPDPRRPYVAVSNHESAADIFLISHLPWEMKWLSKDTLFKIPVMGWMMRMAGDISVSRGRAESRAAALAGMRDRLDKKVSIMIFPEGTRSRTEEMLPFKDGAFRVAIDAGVPILPIAVAGTRNAMAKGSLLFNRAVAEARVFEPVETTGLTREDVGALKQQVREIIERGRQELKAERSLAS